MPVKILNDLPVKKMLAQEGIFSIDQERATTQDIRPLKLIVVNLMPKKIETELQLLRLISQSPLQIEVDFLQTATHQSKNTSATYLDTFYLTFPEIQDKRYDGLIVTGAPVEQMAFEEVDYWPELQAILDWAQTNVTSNLHICWGAQAGLYHYYGIEKIAYTEKLFGIFQNSLQTKHELVRGFSELFLSPQSRYTGINAQQVEKAPVQVIADNHELGPLIMVSEDEKNIFILGHMEYDTETLHEEYLRDQEKNLGTQLPENYYFGEATVENIKNTWRSEAFLLYHNWLNDVYQRTPYEWV